jgi:hypothetical protein
MEDKTTACLERGEQLEKEYQTTLWACIETIVRGAVDDTKEKFNKVFKSKDNSIDGYEDFFNHYSESAFKLHYRYKELNRLHTNVMYLCDAESGDEKKGLGALLQLQHEADRYETQLLRGNVRRQSTDLITNHSHTLKREADQILLADYRQWIKNANHETAVYRFHVEENRKELETLNIK